MRTGMLPRDRRSEGLERMNFISFLLCAWVKWQRINVSWVSCVESPSGHLCVCSSQCPAGLHSWQELRQAVEDGQVDGTWMGSWWDGSGPCECPFPEEVSCGSLHSC